jgi:hypothetical protein
MFVSYFYLKSSVEKVIGLLAVMPAKAGIQTSSKFLDSGSPSAFAEDGRNDV